MGDSKFFLIIASLLAAIVLSFQGCSGIQANGNGDPHEGVGITDSIQIVDGPVSPVDNTNGGAQPSLPNQAQPAADLSSYDIIHQCQSGSIIDTIVFAQNSNGEKRILLRSPQGDLLEFPWDPSQSRTNIFQALSNEILVQEVILQDDGVTIFYFINGDAQEHQLTRTCSSN